MDLNVHLLLPEILVAAGALLVVACDLLVAPARRARTAPLVAGGALLAACVVLLVARPDGTAAFGRFASDAFSRFVRAIVSGGGVLLVAMSSSWTRRLDRGHGEFYGLLLFALVGVMLVSGVQDLMSLFVALELLTICSYVLAAFKRNDLKSTEAGLKYLVIGAVSSAVLLFGVALVYGAAGTVDFAALSAHVAGKGFGPLLGLGTAFLFGGLFFKCSAVPFQVWAPDVYQGAPSPVTGFLSSFSKSAGFVLLLRVVSVVVVPAAGGSSASWGALLGVVAALTLLYGNLGAIPQRDVKRLLAYSSIGHAGYMTMGVAVAAGAASEASRVAGATATLVYVFFYYLTTLLAFAVVTSVSADGRGHRTGSAYTGLHRRSPLLAFAMLLALLSLAGVPPMAGLIGKFLVFYALVDAAVAQPAFVALGLLGAAAVVLSLYYYLLLIRELFSKEPPEGASAPLPVSLGARIVVAAGIVGLIGLGVWWEPVHTAARHAAESLFAAR